MKQVFFVIFLMVLMFGMWFFFLSIFDKIFNMDKQNPIVNIIFLILSFILVGLAAQIIDPIFFN